MLRPKHIFTVCHSRQDNSFMICCLPILEIDIDNQEGYIDIYIYMYREFLAFHFCDLSHCISKFWVGDDRTVNMSMSPHNSDQLGSENAFWFAIICIDMRVILDLILKYNDTE